MKNKNRSLNYYRVSKYNEVDYIKRFILGVNKKELEEMFRKPLLEGFLSMLILSKNMTKDELDKIIPPRVKLLKQNK